MEDKESIAQAADILRRGGLLAIPTETVYGLGANGLDETAVLHIFEAKGRPQDNPLILHIPDASWLTRYCEDVPDAAYKLAERFWPGPLTMILKKKPCVPLRTTGGLETVGMRCPDHAVTRAIIEASGVPVAAPSANTSGRPSCTTAEHVREDMWGKIDGIVDGGPCQVGVESTIIDLTVTPPQLLRPGGLPLESLRDALGEVTVDKAVTQKMNDGEKPRAPGMKYRHYAPKAPVTVVTGGAKASARYLLTHAGEKSGIICFDEFTRLFDGHIVHTPSVRATISARRRSTSSTRCGRSTRRMWARSGHSVRTVKALALPSATASKRPRASMWRTRTTARSSSASPAARAQGRRAFCARLKERVHACSTATRSITRC